MQALLSLVLVTLLRAGHPSDLAAACTAVVVGRAATTDGSTFSASSADCKDCDFRLAKVPARQYDLPARRPVYVYREDYPHVVSARAATWEEANLEGTDAQKDAWKKLKPIGSIPQVARTYALFEGGAGYALVNEKGVGIGETTCPAKFVATPKGHGGEALVDIAELTKIGLERADTARKAVEIMGEVAETYGYYGAEWDKRTRYSEAGESLMVADGEEAWVFHILPDDTGRSAIWAAQRVPETDMTVVANSFIIRKVNAHDNSTFLYSKNMHDIAKKHGFWNPETDGRQLDFSKAFAAVPTPPSSTYSNMRVWRLFTMANPDLLGELDEHADDWRDGYPFSVTPKEKLSIDELKTMYRDHFDGTKYDLTAGEAGGPYGDPDRYDSAPVGNMTFEESIRGEFGRSVSLFRTSYTAIVRGKKSLPDEVGPLLYVAQQQADSSVFVPIYASVTNPPRCFTRGSLFKYSNESLFWGVTTVSNWAHRYYKYAIGDVRAVQKSLEDYNVDVMDAFATRLYTKGHGKTAAIAMQKFSDATAEKALARYLEFFPQLVARFHDGYVMQDPFAPRVSMNTMFYPKWWLKQVGYFSARETGGSYGRTYEPDVPLNQRVRGAAAFLDKPVASCTTQAFVAGVIFGALSSAAAVYFCSRVMKGPNMAGYTPIQ